MSEHSERLLVNLLEKITRKNTSRRLTRKRKENKQRKEKANWAGWGEKKELAGSLGPG